MYLITFYQKLFYIKIKNGGDKIFQIKKDSIEYSNKSLRLPDKLIDRVQTVADCNGISFNKLVIQCIEYALNHMDEDTND